MATRDRWAVLTETTPRSRYPHQVLTETDGSDLDAKLAKFSTQIADTEGDSVHYPNNITLPNLAYFLVAPTLCYQTDFPRTPRIRKGYLLSLTIRLVVLWTLIPAFVVQYMLPLLRNSTEPIRDGGDSHATPIETLRSPALPWALSAGMPNPDRDRGRDRNEETAAGPRPDPHRDRNVTVAQVTCCRLRSG
jgi:hypothetical protein